MKTLSILNFIFLILASLLKGQSSSQIVNSNQYCLYNSVIFSEIDDLVNITDKVLNTDEVLILKFEKSLNEFLKFVNAKRSFKKYRRQYATIVLEGEKYLLINMVNFGNKFIRKNHSIDFNNSLVLGLGAIYEKNTFILLYRINDGSIRFY